MCFHAEKGIKGIGRVRWQAGFLASTQSSVRSPQSERRHVAWQGNQGVAAEAYRVRRARKRMFDGVHFEAQLGYEGSKPKIPMMFPGCIHGKEKD